MIISDKFKFAFIHIRRCAGSTVRHILALFDEAADRYFNNGVNAHPSLGEIGEVLEALSCHPKDSPVIDSSLVHCSRQKDYICPEGRPIESGQLATSPATKSAN